MLTVLGLIWQELAKMIEVNGKAQCPFLFLNLIKLITIDMCIKIFWSLWIYNNLVAWFTKLGAKLICDSVYYNFLIGSSSNC